MPEDQRVDAQTRHGGGDRHRRAHRRRGGLAHRQFPEPQFLLQESLVYLTERRDQEDRGGHKDELGKARLGIEGDDGRRRGYEEEKQNDPGQYVEPIKRGQVLIGGVLAVDDRVGDTHVGKSLGEADHDHHHGHEAEVLGHQQPGQNGELGELQDRNDDAGRSGPICALGRLSFKRHPASWPLQDTST